MSRMWFGTEGRMRWIEAPRSGADVSPAAWAVDGVLQNGGGYAVHSFATHKTFSFSWGDSAAREAAQLMQSYYSGLFGRGLIYFQDPLTYGTNVLPLLWSAPSLALNGEAPHLLTSFPGFSVAEGQVTNPELSDLPAANVTYTLDSMADGYPGAANSLLVPVPDGYQLRLGAFYSRTGSGNIFAAPAAVDGTIGAPITQLTQLSSGATNIVPDVPTVGPAGVRVWVGKASAGAATVTIDAMIGRLFPVGSTDPHITTAGPWVSGQGNSGARFTQPPTYINNTGVHGGQVSCAATFREVGSWEL